MHLQVDVGGPRLGVRWGVVGIGGIVLQAAALLQVGLELLTAPPAGQGEKKRKEKKKGSVVRGLKDEFISFLNIRGLGFKSRLGGRSDPIGHLEWEETSQ